MCGVSALKASNLARINNTGVTFIIVAIMLDLQIFYPVFISHLGSVADWT